MQSGVCFSFTAFVTCDPLLFWSRQDFETATNNFQKEVGPVDLQCPTIDAWDCKKCWSWKPVLPTDFHLICFYHRFCRDGWSRSRRGFVLSLSICIYIFTIYLLIFGSLVPKETLSCTSDFSDPKNKRFLTGHHLWGFSPPRMGARVWVECPLNTGFSRILSCSLVTSTSKGWHNTGWRTFSGQWTKEPRDRWRICYL
jgi:hypothetical protein